MLIGMDVGKEDGEIGVRQPVRYQGPRLPAVHCLGGGERSAEIKRIARRVGVVHQDHLVVPALEAHQVHIVLVEVRVARRLSGDAKRHPVESAVGRLEQVALREAIPIGGERVHDGIARPSDRQRCAARIDESKASVRNEAPRRTDIGRVEHSALRSGPGSVNSGCREPAGTRFCQAPHRLPRNCCHRRKTGPGIGGAVKPGVRSDEHDVHRPRSVDLDVFYGARSGQVGKRQPRRTAIERLRDDAAECREGVERVAKPKVQHVGRTSKRNAASARGLQRVGLGAPLWIGVTEGGGLP